MKKKILYLTLIKKWFDLIKSGKKKEEYRELKPYWISRIVRKRFDEVHFRNGYKKTDPFLRVEYLGQTVEVNNDRIIIKLGKILEVVNS